MIASRADIPPPAGTFAAIAASAIAPERCASMCFTSRRGIGDVSIMNVASRNIVCAAAIAACGAGSRWPAF
ncbi:MAG: hypothetical protein ABW173_03030 [Sphingomonas sp.]